MRIRAVKVSRAAERILIAQGRNRPPIRLLCRAHSGDDQRAVRERSAARQARLDEIDLFECERSAVAVSASPLSGVREARGKAVSYPGRTCRTRFPRPCPRNPSSNASRAFSSG